MTRLFLVVCLLATFSLGALAQTDIDVLYIQKTPLLNFDSANGGWPTAGSTVTWNAKVKNWGSTSIGTITCEWRLNGTVVETDVVTNLAAGETRNVTYNWTWQQSPNTLEFRADTTSLVSEASEQNNIYSIQTNAITYGAWVEQSVYDYFHAHQLELGDGANSFEDWCYRMIKKWNEMHSLAVWPATPNAVVDRIRVEKVVVVADGALPQPYPTNWPANDHTVDLMWGHPYYAADLQSGGYWQVSATGPFFIDFGEMHECNHARYMVDNYGFDCSHDQTNNNILITGLSGQLVAGTALMPYQAWNVVYYNKSNDLMGGTRHYGEYTAGAWNRKAGIRGPSGNQNSPGDIGVFLQNLPQNNWFKFIDNTGAAMAGATVYTYRATTRPGGGGGWYDKYYDNTPDLTLTADANGTVNLGRCPFSSTGSVTSTYGLSNATFVVRVVQGSQEYFTWAEVSDFNIEYWKGNTQNAYYTVMIPWGATNLNTAVGDNQWRQEIYNSTSLTNLVDVKAVDPDSLGGFVQRMSGRPVSSGVASGTFSDKFTRSMFFNKGTYKFYMHTDDGGRLFVDGTKKIDNWSWDGYVSKTTSVAFTSTGLRSVQLDHSNNGGPSIASAAIIPPLDTVPGPDDWMMQIYNSTNLTNLVEVSACPENLEHGFTLDWGDRGAGPTVGGDGFSVRFTRTLDFEAENYRFQTTSDDGVRLYVDGVLQIDDWTAHPPTDDSAIVPMSAGPHTVVVEYYDASGDAQISLSVLPAIPDFDVAYISRTPRYDRYNVSYETSVDPSEPLTGKPYLTPAEQAKQRWPDPGELVTYTAHVKNLGAVDASCSYNWYYDSAVVASGTLPTIASGEEAQVSYSRAWDSEQASHKIKFMADPDNAVPEALKTNNSVEDATNALSLRLHVWQSLYDWFKANAKASAPLGSFDDWAQQSVGNMNRLMSEAVYPGTPQGVPERVRIDEIVIEPDATVDPDPTGTHAPSDWAWDGRQGFTNSYLTLTGGKNYFENNPSYLQTYDPAVIRALSYELGLINLDSFTIPSAGNQAYASTGHPTSQEYAAITAGGPFFSEHEAYALVSNLHMRRGFRGEYLYDLPQTIRLRVLDAYRRPLAGASVKIYQEFPGKTIPSTLKADLTADGDGYVTLPNRSCFGEITTATGHTLSDNPFGIVNCAGENGVLFAKVQSGTFIDYQFIEIPRFNIAKWLGNSDEYAYDLQTSILQSRPTTSELYGVAIHSPTFGFAVGNNGKIVQWDGSTWTLVTSPVTQTLLGVDISPDGTTAIAAGGLNCLAIYSGGVWTKKTAPYASLNSCAAVSNTVMYLGAGNGRLYKTIDGGTSWTTVAGIPTTQGAINSVKFRDANNGIVTPATPPAYWTADGGTTWTAATGIAAGVSPQRDCAFPSAGQAWSVNNQGTVYKSTNSGALWSKYVDFTTNEYWSCIDMFSDGLGWAGGPAHLLYSTTAIKRFEGGRWWNHPITTLGSYNAIDDISLISANDAWAVGKGGLLLRLADTSTGCIAACDSISAVKSLTDGTQITLTGAVGGAYVSAVFPDSVYLEAFDKTSAIKVYTTSGAVLSAPATATGVLGTERGERVLRFGSVSCGAGSNPIRPVVMNLDNVGGQPNWEGTANLALLVRTAGRVSGSVGANWFVVNDGSRVTASDGNAGIKVLCDSFAVPTVAGHFVMVTGVATTEKVGGQVYRVIRPRNTADVVLLD